MRNNNQPSGLAKLLTALLITCAVVETGIASHVGVTVQSNQEANARSAAQYEAYQERQEQVKENPPPVRYVGPEVQVSNGKLVKGAWEPAYISEPTAVVQTPTSALPPAVEPVDPEPVQPETPPAEPVAPEPVQPVAPVTPPKATASTPKADVGSKKAADVPKPSSSGGQSGSQTPAASKPGSSGRTSKPVDTAKPSGGSNTQSSVSNSNAVSSNGASGNSATTKKSDGTYQHDFSGGRILGTKESNKYHNSDCIGARKIPPENEVWYNSVSDAVAAGRESCGSCYR